VWQIGRVRIFLFRHGRAVDETAMLPDEARYLNPTGRRRAREVGARLAKEGVELDAILTSPLVRAVQTAELVADRLGFLGEIEALPQLAPGIPSRLVAQELPTRGVQVGVFGHSPGISDLGAFLCSRPSFPGLKPGQCAVIEDGRPLWWIDPETLALDRLLLA
jgi:phosphohistidine phosphatase